MSGQYLISLSIGPVQDFIAAARRTRDLWFGSFVLSEVSKAAALSFRNSGAKLVFPAPETNLDPDSKGNVGNKLLILVKTAEPNSVVIDAKEAAQKRWKDLANNSKQNLKNINLEEAIWSDQVSDVLEFFSAWICLENLEDYGAPAEQGKGRKRLDQLLNARKNTREFTPNPVLGNSIAKSSLDGLRESVLPQEMKQWQKRKLGLSAGEELDCIGVVKRLGGDAGQFTPLSRLAVDPWLRKLENEKIVLSDITDIFGELLQTNLGLVSQVTGNDQVYDFFPFDGQLLYDFRIPAELESLKRLEQDATQETKDNIDHAKNHLKHLKEKLTHPPFKDLPKPSPYMAILVADGDRMGELLDNLSSIEDHQAISAKLADFATQVSETIRGFFGHCVYAGGDDVLALLPLDQAIACAKKLSVDFKENLQQIKNIDKIPTLSVGLGVSHFLTPMGKQLDLARRAEQLAKSNELPEGQRKNALAILLQPRSGAEISFRERWEEDAVPNEPHTPPDKLLETWIEAHNENLLPRRVGYELREASFALRWWGADFE